MKKLVRHHWGAFVVVLVIGISAPQALWKLGKGLYNEQYGSDGNLRGMTVRPDWVAFNYSNVLDRKLQTFVENEATRAIRRREFYIQQFNQLYFDLFGVSYMYYGNILKGREGQLFERAYVDSYCQTNLDLERESKRIEEWAATLARVQKMLLDHQRVFVYLINPNKGIYYPEFLPPDYRCARPGRMRYQMMLNALNRNGINYVDGSKLVLDLKQEAQFAFFPRGGTHWTYYPAAIVANAVLENIGRQTGFPLQSIEYSYRLVSEKSKYHPWDTDLLNLLNLRDTARYDHDVLPTWIYGQQKAAQRKLSAVFAGGSFTWAILDILADSGQLDPIDFYHYTKLGRYRYPGKTLISKSPEQAEYYAPILDAKVFLLEENELDIVSPHGKMLVEAVLKLDR